MRRRARGADWLVGAALVAAGCGARMPTEASDVDFGERVTQTANKRSPPPQVDEPSDLQPKPTSATAQERGREAGPKSPAASDAGTAADQPVTLGAKPESDAAADDGGDADRQRRRPTAKPSIAASEPAFPGRPGKQAATSPDAAAAAGRSKLRLAEAESRRGNAAAACKLAVEAYAAVSSHAGSDEDCRRVGEEAGRMMDRMGRLSRPANVPTKFE
jgi:hypothetical protein